MLAFESSNMYVSFGILTKVRKLIMRHGRFLREEDRISWGTVPRGGEIDCNDMKGVIWNRKG